ncbi:MAG: hypothetical protein F6J90_35420 [Moorea sp. SIOASIH]|uniref:hypothetical protein n=1 Tax=Moorena sp. SIOASIH TaxID=2607817 RepID=UPI0013B8BB58|nr:hypothetical protein [Moorena sp. SIOASIH]NEO41334.1 hypothetical protein [Moorena sp. SIOASIH]NEO95211.1 hypothetical protein [Moorena sp. SIO3G5]
MTLAKRPRYANGHASSQTDQVHRIFCHSTYAHFPISRFPTPYSRLPKTQNESTSPN